MNSKWVDMATTVHVLSMDVTEECYTLPSAKCCIKLVPLFPSMDIY